MNGVRASIALIFVGASSACGGDASSQSAEPVHSPLCEGGAGTLAFFWSQDPCCENAQDGQDVMFENGAAYLAVDGACNFWSYDSTQGRVSSGALNEADRAEWESALALADLDAATSPSACSVPFESTRFRHGGHALSVGGACAGGASMQAWVAKLRTGISTIRNGIAAGKWSAKPWDEGVRFRLLPDDSAESSPLYANGRAWPLASTPRAGIARADADDAATLRRLRDDYFNGAFGNPGIGIVPITQSPTEHYQLWLRDSIPLEDGNGKIAPP